MDKRVASLGLRVIVSDIMGGALPFLLTRLVSATKETLVERNDINKKARSGDWM